jgi:hypothetical protein
MTEDAYRLQPVGRVESAPIVRARAVSRAP